MTAVVWKYPLKSPVQRLSMPAGARVLCVATQDSMPTLWALVDTDKPCVDRKFIGVGTGMDFDIDRGQYVGTVHGVEGALVFHIFEVARPESA